MPRRRHEEESSSSSRSRSPPPRTERSFSSSPRPAAARSRSRETSGRSAPRPSPRPAPAAAASTPRSSPQPAPAATYVSSPASAPAPSSSRSSSPRTERSTPRTYRASRDDDSYRARSDDEDEEYSLVWGILRGMRRASSDDLASSNDRDRATSHGESLFGDTVRTLLCPPPPVVSEPVAVPFSPCDTQTKALQDCLHKFETDISKCQLYMNTLSRCKKTSDSKLEDVAVGMPRASSESESRFLTIVIALLCPRTVVVSEVASIAPVAAPVAVPASLCGTQEKAFQDCLHEFETDISKCQFYMNMLSRCMKNSDSKLKA